MEIFRLAVSGLNCTSYGNRSETKRRSLAPACL